MSTETFKPIAGSSSNFILNEPSRSIEEQIHTIQVRYAGIDLEARRLMCEIEGWDPEKTIPELSADVRISVHALNELLKHTEPDEERTEDLLRDRLTKIVEPRVKEIKQISFIPANDYWSGIAEVLFMNYKAPEKEGDLNFKEINRAIEFFFA